MLHHEKYPPNPWMLSDFSFDKRHQLFIARLKIPDVD
jgi:hypothetical protein